MTYYHGGTGWQEGGGEGPEPHLIECPILEPFSADETQHCFCSRPDTCIHYEMECICDRLRACEVRVAEETEAAMMKFFYWKPSPPHDQHYFADNICAYCVGYREALSAAREAVKHLQHSDDCYYEEGVLCHCEIKRAITAIDALRKDQR